jgi:hypothetical protein
LYAVAEEENDEVLTTREKEDSTTRCDCDNAGGRNPPIQVPHRMRFIDTLIDNIGVVVPMVVGT